MLIKTHFDKLKSNDQPFAKLQTCSGQKQVNKQKFYNKLIVNTFKHNCVSKSNFYFKQQLSTRMPSITLTFSSVVIKDIIKAYQLVTKMLTNLSSWLNSRCIKSINLSKQQFQKYQKPNKPLLEPMLLPFSTLYTSAEGARSYKELKKAAKEKQNIRKQHLNIVLNKYTLITKQKQNQVFSCFAKQVVTKNQFKNVQKAVQSTHLFTVIRAAFVFKKTREQFTLNKKQYTLTIAIQNKAMQNLLLQCLSSLKLPAEVKITCFY